MGELRLLEHRRVSPGVRRALWMALLSLLGGVQNLASQTQPSGSGRLGQLAADSTIQFEQPDLSMEQHRRRLLNADRQKALVADADKLLKLVSKFNAEIGAANPDSMTPAQLRTLGEIQRLAHSVKTRMSDSIYGTPVFTWPPPLSHNLP